MKSNFRDKKKKDELLDMMCGGQAVAEKFKSNLSAKIGDIPQINPKLKVMEEAVADEKAMVEKGINKSEFNSNERKELADNIIRSVKSFKEEKEKNQEENTEIQEQADDADIDCESNYPLPEGTIIDGRYKVAAKPRQGGFGMTYTATRVGENDGEKVAVKELYPYDKQRNIKTGVIQINYKKPDAKIWVENFKNEANRIQELKEEKPDELKKMNLVITKTNAFNFNKNWYYVMEFVDGNSLADIMYSFKSDEELQKHLPLFYRLLMMDQLSNALQNLHEIGCVHQDISPNNVMISFDNNGNLNLKVIDYGLATNLYKSSDQSLSSVKGAGTQGFTDVFTRLVEYKMFMLNGEENKLKLIDIYSLGAMLGYLCLMNVKFMKIKDFGIHYESAIKNYELVQPVDIDWEEENSVIASKLQLNLIKKLVFDATNPDFDARIQDVVVFRAQLREIMSVNEEFVDTLKKLAYIEQWGSEIKDYSLELSGYKDKIQDLVTASKKSDALELFSKGTGLLDDADAKKDEILAMHITLEGYLNKTLKKIECNDIIKEIECINNKYQEAEECLQKAEIAAEIGDIDLADNMDNTDEDEQPEVKVEEQKPQPSEKADNGSKVADDAKDNVNIIRHVDESNEDKQPDIKIEEQKPQPSEKADNGNKVAIGPKNETKPVGHTEQKGFLKKYIKPIVAAIVLVVGIIIWENLPPMSGGDGSKPTPPITVEQLNDIFEEAHQGSEIKKQEALDWLTDNVKILYKEGDTNFDTNLTKSQLFGVGNESYIIGETHYIKHYVMNENDKIDFIYLEKLN